MLHYVVLKDAGVKCHAYIRDGDNTPNCVFYVGERDSNERAIKGRINSMKY